MVLSLIKLPGGIGSIPEAVNQIVPPTRTLCSCSLIPVVIVEDSTSHKKRGWGLVTSTGVIAPLLRTNPPMVPLTIYSSVKEIRKAVLSRLFPLTSTRPACEQKWAQEIGGVEAAVRRKEWKKRWLSIS